MHANMVIAFSFLSSDYPRMSTLITVLMNKFLPTLDDFHVSFYS